MSVELKERWSDVVVTDGKECTCRLTVSMTVDGKSVCSYGYRWHPDGRHRAAVRCVEGHWTTSYSDSGWIRWTGCEQPTKENSNHDSSSS